MIAVIAFVVGVAVGVYKDQVVKFVKEQYAKYKK